MLNHYALIDDAARLCGVVPNTIRSWIAAGRLSVLDWHGKRVVRLSEVCRIRDNPPQRGRPAKTRATGPDEKKAEAAPRDGFVTPSTHGG